MFKDQLEKFGLTKTQAVVLDFLLENGKKRASNIAKELGMPRGVAYKALDELVQSGVVGKTDKVGEVSQFWPEHPRKMEAIFQKKELKLKEEKGSFEELLPSLVSAYNLTQSKPGVRFYEGEEGFKKVLFDTLTSKTEVLMFLNHDALKEYEEFQKINSEYKNEKARAGIVKKVIRAGVQPDEETFKKTITSADEKTQIKYLGKEAIPFTASVQIYEGKISYQIIENGQLVSVLVENKQIYEMHKAWFEWVWGKLGDSK